MKMECTELLLVEYSEIAEIKKTDQDLHQDQNIFLKTKTSGKGSRPRQRH